MARRAPTADLDELRTWTQSGRSQGYRYVALLGLRTYEADGIHRTIEKGLPYSALEHLHRNTSLPTAVLADLAQITPRTLARRKEQGRLGPEESDRLMRIARVFGQALDLFGGNATKTAEWLSRPLRALGQKIPLDFAKTDVGAQELEHIIGRIQHGIPT
jgi:putative toxin-antitoxin system antitoxin component (TIGR02293 family)